MIKYYANDVKVGDIIRPYINERTMKRTSKEFTVTGAPVPGNGSFSHYVTIPVKDINGKDDEVFIMSDEYVELIYSPLY